LYSCTAAPTVLRAAHLRDQVAHLQRDCQQALIFVVVAVGEERDELAARALGPQRRGDRGQAPDGVQPQLHILVLLERRKGGASASCMCVQPSINNEHPTPLAPPSQPEEKTKSRLYRPRRLRRGRRMHAHAQISTPHTTPRALSGAAEADVAQRASQASGSLGPPSLTRAAYTAEKKTLQCPANHPHLKKKQRSISAVSAVHTTRGRRRRTFSSSMSIATSKRSSGLSSEAMVAAFGELRRARSSYRSEKLCFDFLNERSLPPQTSDQPSNKRQKKTLRR
jgi:hypothetical protein